jgi:hypothetical protein
MGKQNLPVPAPRESRPPWWLVATALGVPLAFPFLPFWPLTSGPDAVSTGLTFLVITWLQAVILTWHLDRRLPALGFPLVNLCVPVVLYSGFLGSLASLLVQNLGTSAYALSVAAAGVTGGLVHRRRSRRPELGPGELELLAAGPGEAADCQYCGVEIAAGQARVTCPACETPHHEDCWREAGACTTFGCAGGATPSAPIAG